MLMISPLCVFADTRWASVGLSPRDSQAVGVAPVAIGDEVGVVQAAVDIDRARDPAGIADDRVTAETASRYRGLIPRHPSAAHDVGGQPAVNVGLHEVMHEAPPHSTTLYAV